MSRDVVLEAVRAGRLAELADLLDGLTDPERRACLPALKALRKELRAEPWGAPAARAYPALHVAGAACHTGAAAAAAWIGAADWRWSRQAPAEVLLHVLGDRETAWLADVAHRLAALPASRAVPYPLVSGLVALSGCAVPTTQTYVTGWVDQLNSTRRYDRSLTDLLRIEPHAAELAVALFETDDIGSRLHSFDPDSPHSWTRGLATLAAEGVVDREVLVDACVARLLRGGRVSDLRVFLKVLDALELSRAEERERSADWAALCADGAAPAAAFAQKVLGALAGDGEVTARLLAETSAAVLFRPEKKLVRGQLVLLGKVLKGRTVQGDPSAVDELLPAVGEAFGHADTDVQERALKLVGHHIDEAGRAAREQLALCAEQLSPGLRTRAQDVFGVSLAEDGPHEEVLPPAPEPYRVPPAPDSAAELAEEVGAILASGGGLTTFERALDGLVRHAYRDREALKEALVPAVSRCWWVRTDQPQFIQRYFLDSPSGLEVVAASVLDAVSTRTLRDASAQGSPRGWRHKEAVLRTCHDVRLWEAARRIRTEPVPLLLATPTWSSGFIEPDELVARLRVYATEGARAGEADFAQALLRVDRGSGRAGDAAAEAAALGTREGARLAAWLTAPQWSAPRQTLRDDSAHVLVDLGEQLDLQKGLPEPFRRLGRAWASRETATPYWSDAHGGGQEHAQWLATLPGQREIVAARLLRAVSFAVVHETRGAAAYLPMLAEAEGPAGQAVHLSVVYGLAARHPEDRLAGVDALLTLAARGELDGALLGSLAARLWELDGVKATRLAEALGTAAATGAYASVLGVLRTLLPALLTSKESASALRGLGDLLAVAADCAERTGSGQAISLPIAGLAEVAARKGASRLVAQARRLHTALGSPSASASASAVKSAA
ncbi:DUF6493 family protein [Streptomyces sp. NPDC050085]|uniref:DUF7824 domain-containing protein n=1 Tax=Streptomyces sp. NPDC050085 TaxID=3365600 RepID=UPI0037BD9226